MRANCARSLSPMGAPDAAGLGCRALSSLDGVTLLRLAAIAGM
jgi:hypothetical protein